VLVHPRGILARVPEPDALAAHLERRLPRRVWARDPGDVLIVLAPWSWLVVGTILAAWPQTEVGAVECLNAPSVAGREAA
jgi:hypothetical protein